MKAFAWISCALLVASLVGFLIGCGSSDERQIMKVIRSSREAFENEDVDTLMGHLSQDCNGIVNSADGGAMQFTGKEELKAAFIKVFKEWDKIKLKLNDIVIKVSGDTATASSDVKHTMTHLGMGSRVTTEGVITANLRRIGGSWEITRIEDNIGQWRHALY
jgi:ketosteroid isomerase-like protein